MQEDVKRQEQVKYKVRAQKYESLARGYSALSSKLAQPAKGAARAFGRLAEPTSGSETGNRGAPRST